MTATQAGPLRVGIVGSCQVTGMGATLRRMWPDAEVKTWHLAPSCPDSPDTIAEKLARCDLAVSQIRGPDSASPLAYARLRERVPHLIYLPVVVFNGFHPDSIYIKINDTAVPGPLGLLHSAIIAGGYALGLPEARVARLFNALTYATLGYYESFGIARELLTRSFSNAGFDLDPLIEGWMRDQGAFMHTANHPRICVLSALAHMAAVKAGLAGPGSTVPDDTDDFLARSVLWPVYPELARRLALPRGDLIVQLGSLTMERGPAQQRALPEIVGTLYALYAQFDKAAFRAAIPPRILAGLEDVLAC